MVLLVRHAHAGDKRHWQGPDSLRPLSAAGQAEAAGLLVDQPLAWPKGSTWLLDSADRRFAVGRYLPPLPLGDALTPATAPRGVPANGLRQAVRWRRRDGATVLSRIGYGEVRADGFADDQAPERR